MLCKEFNKIGDTSFRVKSQVSGYIQLAQFLLNQFDEPNQMIKKIDKKEIDKKFKEYAKREQIYSYNNDKVVKDRFQLVIKLFNQIKLVKKEKNYYEIYKDKLESLVLEPTKNFFDLFVNNFNFFKEGMTFLFEKEEVDPFIFSSTLQIFEKQKDNFSDLYYQLCNNYEDALKQMVYKLFNTNNPLEINPKDFLKVIKKRSNDHHFIVTILEKMHNNKKIDEEDIYNMTKSNLISRYFISMKINGFIKNKTTKNRNIKNKDIILKEYFKKASYSDFIMDINIARLWALIGDEYNDLMLRWLNDFKLISNHKTSNNSIYFRDEKFNFKEINHEIKKYPYNEDIIKKNLINISKNNYSFKLQDENLKNISNSTLAEYFVNLYFAYKNNIKPNNFSKYSRTKLQYGTLFPMLHAPGKGPDMYLINGSKLTTIETTIHKNANQVIRNEIFSIIDHVNLNKINFLSKKEKEKLNSTEIILVTPIKDEKDIKNIKSNLDINYKSHLHNCGNPRISYVTNFKKIIDL